MSGLQSPSFPRGMIARAVPRDMRVDILADVEELFSRQIQRNGMRRARMWYWMQAVSFTTRFFIERIRPKESHVASSNVSLLDWKIGARMLRKYPGLSLISVLALAVAIGVGATTFEFMQSELRPRMPFADGDRIVNVGNWDIAGSQEEQRSLYDFLIWKEQLKSIDHLGAYRLFDRNLLTTDGRTEPVRVAEISSVAFPLTGVPPMLGRPLGVVDEAPNAAPVVLIGYDVWKTRFNGDRGIVGRTVHLGRATATVIGVMPDRFAFPRNQQAWVPLHVTQVKPRQGPPIGIFGRLTDGTSMKTAQTELDVVARRMATENPQTHAQLNPEVRWFGTDHKGANQGLFVSLTYLGTFMILLAACANVATLVFARTAMRESEIVVRNALGATRGRVMAQLFTEALVLALVAAAVGLLASAGFMQFVHHEVVIVRKVPQPFWTTYTYEASTVVYAVLLAVAGAVLIGLLPAIKATGSSVQRGLQSMRGGTNMRFGGVWSVIIILQVAFTVMCLPIGIGVTQETLRDHKIRAAFAADQYLTFQIGYDREATLSTHGEMSDEEYDTKLAAVYQELERRLVAEPGVAAVTYADRLPGKSLPMIRVEAQKTGEAPFMVDSNRDGYAHLESVDPDFFDVFRIPLLAGRAFQAGDVGSTAVNVVINESLAKNIGGNALGVRIRYTQGEHDPKPSAWYQVVGVVKNLGMEPTGRGETDQVYLPVTPANANPTSIALRLNRDAASFGPRVGQIALQIDPGLRLYDLLTLNEVVRRRDTPMILTMTAAIGVVILAIILSSAGLFALMSVSVARRRREIGIRLALGASRAGVLRAVFARSAAQVGTGILLGNALILVLFSMLSGELRADVLGPMAGVSLIMAFVGAAACAVPARRALRVHPTEALQEPG